ncbi:MAG: hypothetical protein V7K24_03635 [Nostoc sp.]
MKLQQFSTLPPLAYLISLAGQIQSNDLMLEPSAGTGILTQFAKRASHLPKAFYFSPIQHCVRPRKIKADSSKSLSGQARTLRERSQ